MKKGVFLVVLGLMSWTVAGSAFAGPFGPRFRPPARSQQHALPQGERENDNADKEHGEKAGPNQPMPPGPAHEGQEPRSNPAQGQAMGGNQPFGGRGNGARMSVEDRQKLRRQINEAGRSLYTPPGAPAGGPNTSGNK